MTEIYSNLHSLKGDETTHQPLFSEALTPDVATTMVRALQAARETILDFDPEKGSSTWLTLNLIDEALELARPSKQSRVDA